MADNIPTIPGSARVQPQAIGTRRDPTQAIRAGNAARGAIASAQGALDQGLGVIAEYEEKKRKAEEAYAFNSSSLSFQKMHTDFLHNVKKQPDEQIVTNWTAATQQWRQDQIDQYGGKLSPRAMNAFQMNMDNAIGGSTAKFQVVADQLASQRRLGAADANSAEFLKSGDPEMMKRAIAAQKLATKAGDQTQDQEDAKVATFKEALEKNKVLNGIDSDAYATLQKLKAGGYKINEADTTTLRNSAEKQVDFTQRVTAADLTNDFGMTNVSKTDKELQDLKKAGKITGTYVDNYKKMVAREDYKKAQDKQALMLNRLRDLDLTDSDNPEKDVRQVTDESAHLPPQLQKEIHTLADSKIKAAKTAQEKTVHSDQLDQMREAHDLSVARIPVSPRTASEPARRAEGVEELETMSDEKFTAQFGEDADRATVVKNAKAYVKAEDLRYAKAQKSYVTWSHTKKGAEASPADADAERERLGFGRYTTTEDVAAAYKAGKIDRGTAKGILFRQFGVP